MSTVDFTIDGLAACYLKPNETGQTVWNILFPCDAVHVANFWYTKNGAEIPEAIPLINKTITILAPDATSPTSSEKSLIDRTLNLSGRYLHKEGVMRTAIPTIDKSFMTIEKAILYSKAQRSKIMAFSVPLNPIKYPEGPKIAGYEMTQTIGGRIEIPDTKVITIKIDRLDIQLAAGDSFRIDNHCPNNCGNNDFDLYSKVFGNRQFADKTHTILTANLEEYVEIQTNEKGGISILTANPPAFCDGVIIDPPPSS
jgi:hypothetical protein